MALAQQVIHVNAIWRGPSGQPVGGLLVEDAVLLLVSMWRHQRHLGFRRPMTIPLCDQILSGPGSVPSGSEAGLARFLLVQEALDPLAATLIVVLYCTRCPCGCWCTLAAGRQTKTFEVGSPQHDPAVAGGHRPDG